MADILPPIEEEDKMLSGLAYPLWPLIVPMIMYGPRRQEPFVHFNALQGLAVGVASLVASLVIGLFSCLVMFILPTKSFMTFSGAMGLLLFCLLVFIVFLYMSVILYISWRVASGKFVRLPFAGTWAEHKMQENLGITEESYATGIIGERRQVDIQPFDYLKVAPQLADDYEDPHRELNAEDISEDGGDFEFSAPVEGNPYDLLKMPPAPNETAAVPGTKPGFTPGFTPKPGPIHQPSTARPASQMQRLNVPPASAPAPAAKSAGPADGFTPLTATRGFAGGSQPAASNASSGFKWKEDFSAPKPQRPASATVVPPQAPQPDQSDFKPGLLSADKKKRDDSTHRFQWGRLE